MTDILKKHVEKEAKDHGRTCIHFARSGLTESKRTLTVIEDRARQKVKTPRVSDDDGCSRAATHRGQASTHSSSRTKGSKWHKRAQGRRYTHLCEPANTCHLYRHRRKKGSTKSPMTYSMGMLWKLLASAPSYVDDRARAVRGASASARRWYRLYGDVVDRHSIIVHIYSAVKL